MEAEKHFYRWPCNLDKMTDYQIKVYQNGAGYSEWTALERERCRRLLSKGGK